MKFALDEAQSVFKAINVAEDLENFINPFTLISSSSDIKCSFNGGCDFSMSGTAGV